MRDYAWYVLLAGLVYLLADITQAVAPLLAVVIAAYVLFAVLDDMLNWGDGDNWSNWF